MPETGLPLAPDWALQDPEDYLRTLQVTIPQVLQDAGVSPQDVIGVGIDFTACTMLPVRSDGTPLCMLPEWRGEPHAWVKLWKHHAAQPEADEINRVARETGKPGSNRYGGKISSEWFFSKSLQILNEAPAVYAAADRLIEAADWVVWQLTGIETRNSCTAGYKALWSKREGFPPQAYFGALHPEFGTVVEAKMSRDIRPVGEKAGGLTQQAAAWTGLMPGTAVAIANVDAHVAVPAATVTEPGRMVMIMGTSICHMVLGTGRAPSSRACAGAWKTGSSPASLATRRGNRAWATISPGSWRTAFRLASSAKQPKKGSTSTLCSNEKAAALAPGESGLLALDWWNGNRSVLVDVDLAGLLLGATLATRPEEIYRALIEATAFGTRVIVETFQQNGVPIHELVACGGLPEKNRLLMQIYSDVTGLPIRVSASKQTPALGSAMFGAVAAGARSGGYDTIYDAASRMARLKDEAYRARPGAPPNLR